jgi:hypothetical protein
MLADPAQARARWALPLLRVLPGASYLVELAGARWFFFGAHWLERGLLCIGEACPGCAVGVPRVLGYRAAILRDGNRRRNVLVEASAGAVSGLEGLLCAESVVNDVGCPVEVTRRHRRSPVRLEPAVDLAFGSSVALDDSVTLNAVALLYNLPLATPGEPAAEWASRVRRVAEGLLVRSLVGRV